jgi:hypothetical protein
MLRQRWVSPVPLYGIRWTPLFGLIHTAHLKNISYLIKGVLFEIGRRSPKNQKSTYFKKLIHSLGDF